MSESYDYYKPVSPLQSVDKLFINDDARIQFNTDHRNSVPLPDDFRQQEFLSYALGYKTAADSLVASHKDYAHGDIIIVFPVVFLYRQYLELSLKNLILLVENKLNQHTKKHFKTHNLKLLWDRLKVLLSEISPTYVKHKDLEIAAVETCIIEFQEVDRADAFRYPVDNEGESQFNDNQHLQNIKYINLSHLAEKMDSLTEFLLQALALCTFAKIE